MVTTGKQTIPDNQAHIIQRVLNNFSHTYTLDTTQSDGGVSATKGGVMPDINNITILQTTPDVLKARLGIPLDGFGFQGKLAACFPLFLPLPLLSIWLLSNLSSVIYSSTSS